MATPGPDEPDTTALRDALAAGQRAAVDAELTRLTGTRAGRDAALEVLAAAGRSGDPRATTLLVEQLDATGVARAAAASVLVDEQAVEEVAQDTLVVVANRLGTFRGDARFTTWVHGIARRRAVDHLRARRADAPEPSARPARRISSVIASRAAVDQLLARLPDGYRHAVALRDVEQLSYTEVAARLGCPESTARTRVTRGRAMVAQLLADDVDLGITVPRAGDAGAPS